MRKDRVQSAMIGRARNGLGGEKKKIERLKRGLSYYRPWINLLTSFRATTGHHADSGLLFLRRGTSINRTL